MTVFLHAAGGGVARAQMLATHGQGPFAVVFLKFEDRVFHDPLQPWREMFLAAFEAALVREAVRP